MMTQKMKDLHKGDSDDDSDVDSEDQKEQNGSDDSGDDSEDENESDELQGSNGNVIGCYLMSKTALMWCSISFS